MDKRPIGIFDSGLGGLTAAKELMQILPGENLIYFGDTGRVPYGTRSPETITRYATQDVTLLLHQQVKAILCACGTVSSVAGELLKSHTPCPFYEIVGPTAAAAVSATSSGKIGVIGTDATIGSGKFPLAIRNLLPTAEVFSKPCPLFVPLVESGHIAPGDPLPQLVVELYLSSFREAKIDTLILGCTHYPLLAPVIKQFLGEEVMLIDSGREAANALRQDLAAQGLVAEKSHSGIYRFLVSDSTHGFAQVAEQFLGRAVSEQVEKIDIGTLESLSAL